MYKGLPKRNHQKPFADPEHCSYDVNKDYIINCPAQLRILPYGGGEARVYYTRAWGNSTRFWCIADLTMSKVYYLPTIEACVRVELFGRNAERSLYKIARREVIHKDRYLISEIDKKHFIEATGRTHEVCWRYASQREDRAWMIN